MQEIDSCLRDGHLVFVKRSIHWHFDIQMAFRLKSFDFDGFCSLKPCWDFDASVFRWSPFIWKSGFGKLENPWQN